MPNERESNPESPKVSAEDRLIGRYHEMEETITRHQLEALDRVTPHPPKPPYRPK